MRARKKGVVGLVIAIALMMVLLAGMLYFSYAGDSYNVDNALTGAAIGIGAESSEISLNDTLAVDNGVKNNPTLNLNSSLELINETTKNNLSNFSDFNGPLVNPNSSILIPDDPVEIILPEPIVGNETELPINDPVVNDTLVNKTRDNQKRVNRTIPEDELSDDDLLILPIVNESINKSVSINQTNETVNKALPAVNFTNRTQTKIPIGANNTNASLNAIFFGPQFLTPQLIEILADGPPDNAGFEDYTKWNKTIAVSNNDQAQTVARDSLDSIYVGGDLNNDWWLKKYYKNSSEEVTLWNKTYSSGMSAGTAPIQGIAVDSNNNIYVAGIITSGNNWWIKRFNSSGTENVTEGGVAGWNLTFGSGGGGIDQPHGMDIDSQNNVYVVGEGENIHDGDGVADWWIKKFYGLNGSEDTSQWNKTAEGAYVIKGQGGNDRAQAVVIDSNDLIYVVGSVDNTNSADWWIKRFNRSGYENVTAGGVTGWNLTFDMGGTDIAYDVAVDSNNDVYVLGSATSETDWWVKKFYGFNGSEDTSQWNKTFSGAAAQTETPRSLTIDSFDNIYVVGDASNIAVSGQTTSNDWLIKRYNRTGGENITHWNKTFDFASSVDVAFDVVTDSANNVTVVGYATDDSLNTKWWIKRFTSTDENPPIVTFTSPTNGSNSTLTSQTITATVFDLDIYTVVFAFDNATGADFNRTITNSSGTWTRQEKNLAEGFHTVTAHANDTTGNLDATKTVQWCRWHE